MKSIKNERLRLQFEITEDGLKRLDEMQEMTEAASRAEVIRNALTVYENIVLLLQWGGSVKAENAEGQAVHIFAPVRRRS